MRRHLFHFLFVTVFCALCASCGGQRQKPEGEDGYPEFSNIQGDEQTYSRPVIITGHISHREVYPNTKEISLTIPFFDRVEQQTTSWIGEDGSFALSFLPYAPRSVSIPPFIDHLLVCPGDSIHIELDFADIGTVVFSGDRAEDNAKLHTFYSRYYVNTWPSDAELIQDGDQEIPVFLTAESYLQAARANREEYLSNLEKFIAEEKPGNMLAAFCRAEIETDYYSHLLQNIPSGNSPFRLEEVEKLFDGDFVSGKLFDLSDLQMSWLYKSGRVRKIEKISELPIVVASVKKVLDNQLASEMAITGLYEELLERQEIYSFEEQFDFLEKNVSHPLLKMTMRERYYEAKQNQLNPRKRSDAILYADRPKDGKTVPVKRNEGLELLRDIVGRAAGNVLYINIGATWCAPSAMEAPSLRQLAKDYRQKPLRIVQILLDKGDKGKLSLPESIEILSLSDAQRLGLDPILHFGRGIPFYLLVDPAGVIVEMGSHLRPSNPSTREKIDRLLE